MKFMEMLTGWVRLMASRIKDYTSWYDPFGDLYMALVSQSAQQSQGAILHSGTYLRPHGAVHPNGRKKKDRTEDGLTRPAEAEGCCWPIMHGIGESYLIGEDINRTYCLMTVCNMLIHGCVGEVICHDSLNPETSWTVGRSIPCLHGQAYPR